MRGHTAHRPLTPISWNDVYANGDVDAVPYSIYARMLLLTPGQRSTVMEGAAIVKVWCEYVFTNILSTPVLVN